MVDRIFDLVSGDRDRIAAKQTANEFSLMPPSFLAGMYATEQFNANRVASSVTSLLSILQENIAPESLDAHEHADIICDVGPVLVDLGKVMQQRNLIPAEFQTPVNKAVNELVNDINRDFRMTKLPIYVAKMSKFIPLQYKIGMYDMSDADLDALLNLESQDIRSVCQLLSRACEITVGYKATTASDTLRIAIYYALNHTLTVLHDPQYLKYSKIMDHLEPALIKYFHIFTDKQKKNLLDNYRKLCIQFSRSISADLAKKLEEISVSPYPTFKSANYQPTQPAPQHDAIFIEELKAWRAENYNTIYIKQRVDVDKIVTYMKSLFNKYSDVQIANVLISLINREVPTHTAVKLWKLVSKANKLGQLFDRQKSKELNDSLDALIVREYQEHGQEPRNYQRREEPKDPEIEEFRRTLRPSFDVRDRFQTTLNTVKDYLSEININAQLYGSFRIGLSTNSSDLNLSVYSDLPDAISTIHAHLSNKPGSTTIVNGRVTFVRYVSEQDITVQIVYNNVFALRNSELVKEYCKRDCRTEVMCRLVRAWARKYEVEKGGLNLYVWTALVIHYLQSTVPPVLPKLQTPLHQPELLWGRDVFYDKTHWFRQENTANIHTLMKGFFPYLEAIANRHDQVIVMRTGELVTGEAHPYLFNIWDYFEEKQLSQLKRDDLKAKEILVHIRNAISTLDRNGSNVYALLNNRQTAKDVV